MTKDSGSPDVLVALVPHPDLTPSAAEVLAGRLRAELRGLDLESVRSVPSDPDFNPTGSGGQKGDPFTLGTLAVVLTSPSVLAGLIGTIRDWLGRQPVKHTIVVKIDNDEIVLDQLSVDERQAIVAFLRRHGSSE